MKRPLFLILFALSAACAKGKDCPEIAPMPPNRVCGPKSAFLFPPHKGEEVKVFHPRFVRLAVSYLDEQDGRPFQADDLCILRPETVLVMTYAGDEYVVVNANPPTGIEGSPLGRPCPDAHLLMSIREWWQLAAENEEAFSSSRSEEEKRNRKATVDRFLAGQNAQ